MKKVLVFGTFDELHDGHRFFLRFAKEQGDFLVASVADDILVYMLKKRKPQHDQKARMQHLLDEGLVDQVIPGDNVQGTWTPIREVSPESIVVGYDQDELYKALLAAKDKYGFTFTLLRAPSHEGDTLHTSLLRENKGSVQ